MNAHQSIIERLNAALSGRYTIERELGEGGMATVYLARDEKHNRNVALKVLKPELAAVVGADRFLAEIETTAQLQHPHILPLFDSGEADSFLFYVMPYIEGETLRERIDRDKQLPVDEAIGIAVAVANALQTAHEAGVVHRDIKPGNILMSRGEPLVADFGIALAVGTAGGSRLTETGLSVGTPYYMSPEQATGDQLIGPASDIYALAAVVYELLVGEPPYVGNTAQAVLGKILQGVPVSATSVRKTIPPHVDAALRKALEKLPADRFTSAGDFARALGDPSFRHGVDAAAGASAAEPWKRRFAVAAGIAVIALGAFAWAFTRTPDATPTQVDRFESPLRPGQAPVNVDWIGFDLTADGSALVYMGPSAEGNLPQLWIRRWNDLESVPIRGTEAGGSPSFSPDGTEVVFVQGNEIKVVPLGGGPIRNLGPGVFSRWGRDGYIYADLGTGAGRILPTGGTFETVYEATGGETAGVADVLPGGTHALLWVTVATGEEQVRLLDLETGQARFITTGVDAAWSPTGHILYVLDNTLMAAPFDLDRMEETGPGVALEENVFAYRVSDTGRLFYSTGGGSGGRSEFVWVDRRGAEVPVEAGWTFETGGANASWTLSPDGTRIAYREATETGLDVWIKELGGGPRSRLTFAEEEDRQPTWGPDERSVTFLTGGQPNFAVQRKRADGTDEPQLVMSAERSIAQALWTNDGSTLIVRTGGTPGQVGGRDILMYRPETDTAMVPLLDGAYDEINPAISPDGRWLAYSSNETGIHEIFVRPFPDVTSGRWQVSTSGGFTPRWSRDGSELFYLSGGREMTAASIETAPSFRVTAREPLFELGSTAVVSDINIPYDVGDDGRFLMARAYRPVAEDDADPPSLILVLNWFEELRERVPR